LCTVVAVLAVFPSLLRLVEPTGLLNPKGRRLYNAATGDATRPAFRYAWLFLGLAAVLTAGLLPPGPPWRFLYDLDALGFRTDASTRADSLLRAAGEDLPTPAVFLAPDADAALRIAEALRKGQAADPKSPVGDVTTLKDLLPADQAEKLE